MVITTLSHAGFRKPGVRRGQTPQPLVARKAWQAAHIVWLVGTRGTWGGYLWLGTETYQLDGAPAGGPRIWGHQFMKPVLCFLKTARNQVLLFVF